MSALDDMFGGKSTAEQFFLWAVMAQLANDLMSPAFNEARHIANRVDQTVFIPPADLADYVVKGWLDHASATQTAKDQGVAGGDFDIMVRGAGEPIGLQEALFAWRRGLIPFDAPHAGAPSVETAIRTSHIANLWSDTIKGLGFVPIGVADAVDAVVENQIDYTAGEKIAHQNGVTADDFKILVHTRGNPPGPSELVELVRRGFIPMRGTGPDATTLQQGIYEGATKDKWEPLYEKLTDYLPPPRTVTALQRAGAITADEAHALYSQQGLSPTLAAAYVANASHDKTTKHRDLAESVVVKLYADRAINAADATSMLGKLGFDAPEAHFILQVQELQVLQHYISAAISRVHNLFVNHKIATDTTKNALSDFDVPAAQVDQLMQLWTLERADNVKVLTPAEIADAVFYKIIDVPTGIAELVQQGYSQYDAWVRVSIRLHSPQGAPPAGGPPAVA